MKTTYYCLKSNYTPFKPCQWLFEIVQCEWKFLSNVNMWYSLKLSKEHRGYPRNIYLLGKIVISLNYKFHSEASIIFKYWINRKKILQTPKYCMWLLLVRKRNLLDSGRVFSSNRKLVKCLQNNKLVTYLIMNSLHNKTINSVPNLLKWIGFMLLFWS